MSGVAWWQTLLSVLAGGALTLLGTVWVGRLNRRASGREEWFRRVQWAQSLTTAEDEPTRVAGYDVLAQLSTSRLATKDDQEMLAQLVKDPDLAVLVGATDETVEATDYVVEIDTGHDDDESVDASGDTVDNENIESAEGGERE